MNAKGQALLETVAFFAMLSVLLAGWAGLTRWILVREKILLGVEESALLYSSGHFTPGEVRRATLDFMTHGTPALDATHLRIAIGRYPGFLGFYYQLDQIMIRYSNPEGWYWLLRANPVIEEQCVIRHAPTYWAPFQPWGGPAVPW